MNMPTKRTGLSAQMIVGILAGIYGISPVDAIPDFIPIAGQADDVAVILAAVVLMLLITLMQGANHE